MYSKLFGFILDSSIWLEPHETRIVWITLLAAMDEDGFAHFSAIENLANRARVSVEAAQKAIECFLAPDPNSSNPANDGRRVERVPGGFMVLNAAEHRARCTREIKREQTRQRVANWRAARKPVTNADVTNALPKVTPVYASDNVPCTLEDALKFSGQQHPKYERRFVEAWFEHRAAQDPPWTKTSGMRVTERNWQADLTKWVMSNRRGDFQSGAGDKKKDRAGRDDKSVRSKPKNQEPIPDKMRSWLAEFLNDDEQLRKWKVVGDIPEAYRQSYWAAQQKKGKQ